MKKKFFLSTTRLALCAGVLLFSGVTAHAQQNACTQNVCASEPNIVRQWNRVSDNLETGKNNFKTLKDINAFVNSFPYKSDLDNYGVSDYWASPKEFFANKSGDCEDYVIAKYALALESGLIKSADARLEIVFDRQERVYHMILIINNLVLDNQNEKIITLNEAKKQRYDMKGEVREMILHLRRVS